MVPVSEQGPAASAYGVLRALRMREGGESSGELIKRFKSKAPEWNVTTGSYELDFRERAHQASEKNLLIVADNGEEADGATVCLLGKVDDDRFNIDFERPFSAVQAFAFALACFENAAHAKAGGASVSRSSSKKLLH